MRAFYLIAGFASKRRWMVAIGIFIGHDISLASPKLAGPRINCTANSTEDE